GKGRFPEIEDIVEALRRVLAPLRDLAGDRVLVTAGPTREPIEPVRYISNRSSGKMGYGLAVAALRRGANVTLISGPTALTPPPGAVFVPVQTAEEMREAVLHHLDGATIVVKAAAVADYRAKHAARSKIKGKHDLTLELTPNPDILAEVAARRTSTFVVGFAAETHDVAANARAKLESKGIDLLVANDVSQIGIGFDAEDNEVLLLARDYLRGPAETLRAQEKALQGCRQCKLCEARSTVVFGSGNPRAEFVVIGEGPGAEEDAQGLPFVGRAGQLLTKMLGARKVELARDEVYIG